MLSVGWWNILISSLPIPAFLSPTITFTFKLLVPWLISHQGSHDKMKFPLRIAELIYWRCGKSVNIRKKSCPLFLFFAWLIKVKKNCSVFVLLCFQRLKRRWTRSFFRKKLHTLKKTWWKLWRWVFCGRVYWHVDATHGWQVILSRIRRTTTWVRNIFQQVHIYYSIFFPQDNDLSRYIPGKVKVSAPNLQKIKKK